jgi:hypothetical protein
MSVWRSTRHDRAYVPIQRHAVRAAQGAVIPAMDAGPITCELFTRRLRHK